MIVYMVRLRVEMYSLSFLGFGIYRYFFTAAAWHFHTFTLIPNALSSLLVAEYSDEKKWNRWLQI